MNWDDERTKLTQFLGRTVRLEVFGYTYDWKIDTSVCVRNTDQKPFVMAWPIKRISGKQGHLRGVQVFHAEFLPEKPS